MRIDDFQFERGELPLIVRQLETKNQLILPQMRAIEARLAAVHPSDIKLRLIEHYFDLVLGER
jgi:hypothetical protein